MLPACNQRLSTFICGFTRTCPRNLLAPSKSDRYLQQSVRNLHVRFSKCRPSYAEQENHHHLDFLLPSFATPTKACRRYREGARNFRRSFWKRSDINSSAKSNNSSSPRYADPLTEKGVLGRSFTLQNHGDVMLRCTEFDQEGKVKAISRSFKKVDLCTKHGLLPRDLRKLESNIIVPHILVRKNSILVNLLHVRALIKADAVLLFDVQGSTDSHTQSIFMYDLQGKLSSEASKAMGGLPYEMRALESILISVTSALEMEMKLLDGEVSQVLTGLEDDIDRDKLRFLLVNSKKLSTFEQKAKLIRGAIDEVLEADDDLANMYLTEKSKGIIRPPEEHSEVEMLLESYYKVTDEVVQTAGNLVSNVRNTEDIVNIILDANRNALMLLDLKFSIGTLGIGSAAFIAGLFGMNLLSGWEESNVAFWGVTGVSAILGVMILTYGLHKLRTTQRRSMWSERGKGRKWWRSTPIGRNPEIRMAIHKAAADIRNETLNDARQNQISALQVVKGK